jgi:hypothetical protein
MERTMRDHRVENLQRTRAIINGHPPPEKTVEEILAEESARLGVKLTISEEKE